MWQEFGQALSAAGTEVQEVRRRRRALPDELVIIPRKRALLEPTLVS
jgi:hypothetical protein